MKASKFAMKLGLALTLALLFVSCKKTNSTIQDSLENTVTFSKEGQLRIQKQDSSVVKLLEIEIADTDYETETGLMYRESMAENRGMLFIFPDVRPHSFYMKNTLIPLDIVYINENKKIVHIVEDAKPLDETGLPSEFPVKYVLELNAGSTQKWGVALGDFVDWEKN